MGNDYLPFEGLLYYMHYIVDGMMVLMESSLEEVHVRLP